MSVHYDRLTVPLINAVQTLSAQVSALDARLAALESSAS